MGLLSRPRSPHKGQDSEVRVDKNVYGGLHLTCSPLPSPPSCCFRFSPFSPFCLSSGPKTSSQTTSLCILTLRMDTPILRLWPKISPNGMDSIALDPYLAPPTSSTSCTPVCPLPGTREAFLTLGNLRLIHRCTACSNRPASGG